MLLGIFVVGTAFAMTIAKVKVECPIDAEEFEFYAQGSGTTFGYMLDERPYGPIKAPWPLAKCPKDGMVLYKKFSAQEIAVLKPFVKSKKYQSLQKSETDYWLAYLLAKRLSAPMTEQIFLMQQATWEAMGERYEKYARATIQAIDSLRKPSVDLKLLKGELHRRIREFGKASQVFLALKSELKNSADVDPIYHQIVSQQLKLIEEKDSSPQPVR